MHRYEELYRMGHVRSAKIVEPDDFIVNFVSTLKKKGSKTILDVGCGAGRNAVFLAKEGFYVVGLDISPTSLKLALEKANDENVNNCIFVTHDFLKLPFPDAHFDAAFSSYGIENVSLPKIKKALSEMKRVVRNGGLILVTLHSTKHWRFGQGKKIGSHTFLTSDTIEGEKFRIISHFFEKETAERLSQDLNLKILSIREAVKVFDKQRAHWIILSEK